MAGPKKSNTRTSAFEKDNRRMERAQLQIDLERKKRARAIRLGKPHTKKFRDKNEARRNTKKLWSRREWLEGRAARRSLRSNGCFGRLPPSSICYHGTTRFHPTEITEDKNG